MGICQSSNPPQAGAEPQPGTQAHPRAEAGAQQGAQSAQAQPEKQLLEQQKLQQQIQEQKELERKQAEEEEEEARIEALRKEVEEKKAQGSEIVVNEFEVYDPEEQWWDTRKNEPKTSSLHKCFQDNKDTFNLRSNNYVSNDKFEFIIDFGKESLLTFVKGTFGRGYYSAQSLIVYSGKNDESTDDNDWTQRGIWKFDGSSDEIKKINDKEFKVVVSKESNQDRYYRFVFEDNINSSYIELRRLQFFGDKGVLRQNISKSIKARDFSGCYNNNDRWGIEKIFDRDSYWQSRKNEKGWVIFDCRDHKIEEICVEFYTHRWGSKIIELTTSNSINGEFSDLMVYSSKKANKNSEISKMQRIKLESSGMNHGRYIRMEFKEMIDKCVEISQIKFFGISQSMNDSNALEDELYRWEEMKSMNEDDFVEKEDAVDVTLNGHIKLVDSFPKFDLSYGLANAYNPKAGRAAQFEEYTNRRAATWMYFDVGNMKIDCFKIQFTARNHCNTLCVYTSNDSNINGDSHEWDLIAVKRNIDENSKSKMVLSSNHGRYIKIEFRDRYVLKKPDDSGKRGINDCRRLEIQYFQWSGFEPVIKDDITSKIRSYQSSPNDKYTYTDATNVLSPKSEFVWKCNQSEYSKNWIIFDCWKYEIERIFFRFGKKCKPGRIKIRLSNVMNNYSFENRKSDAIIDLKRGINMDNENWVGVDLNEEIDVKPFNIYSKNGFQRYMRIEWCDILPDSFEIIQCKFFGQLSKNIEKDSEQFDPFLDEDIDGDNENKDESKGENNKPKPITVFETCTSQSNSVGSNVLDYKNEWSCFVSNNIKEPKYMIFDLGYNDIDTINVTAAHNHGFNKLKISTCDRKKAKDSEWQMIAEDKTFLKHPIAKGGRYDIKDKHSNYIKLEFDEIKLQNMVGVSKVKFYGDTEFCSKEEKELALKDLENCHDDEIIEEYRKQDHKQREQKWGEVTMKMNEYAQEEDPDKSGLLSDKWKADKKLFFETHAEFLYNYSLIASKLAKTDFEEKELLDIYNQQREIAVRFGEKYLKQEIEVTKVLVEAQKVAKEKQNLYEKTRKESPKERKLIAKLLNEQREADNRVRELDRKCTENLQKCSQEMSDEINKFRTDKSRGGIYQAWKESVLHHCDRLSNKYNVFDYENVSQYGNIHDKQGMKECFGELANVFDKCIKDRKERLHKYHVFQLSQNYIHHVPDNSIVGTPKFLVFDCNDREIYSVEWKIGRYCDINRIRYYTANEILKENNNGDNMDDDEIGIDWSNFELIGETIIKEEEEEAEKSDDDDISIGGRRRKKGGILFNRTKEIIYGKHKKYLKVVFDLEVDFDDEKNRLRKNNKGKLVIEKVRFKVKALENEISEDLTEPESIGIDKFKLDICGPARFYNRYKLIGHAFNNIEKDYFQTGRDPDTRVIFDTNDRKVDKFEIRARSVRFERFIVSTSDSIESNSIDDNKDNDNHMYADSSKWQEIFVENNCKDKKYDKEIQTIELNGNHKRYIQFYFPVETWCAEINHLKFYTTDPDDMEWDYDKRYINLSSKIKILSQYSSVGKDGSKHSSIFKNSDRHYFEARHVFQNEYNRVDIARNIICDNVCKAINQLRKSNGGKLDSNEKHFCKYLLCFQNETRYDEMLMTSKKVMNILRRPLDIEYKRLQSINAKILTLKLDDKDKMNNVKSNLELLVDTYKHWYKPRTALFWPKDLKPLSDEWIKVGLNVTDKEFSQIRQSGLLDTNVSFASSEQVAMEFLNYIAHTLDPSFQESMRNMFVENRTKLNLNTNVEQLLKQEIGVLSGPVKTKARQNVKVKLDYYSKPAPQCMAVLDIVRCAIICEDDNELSSLFELLCSKFSGKILRVKNAFDVNKGTYGYRAVLMNIAYGDKNILPEKYEMIVEIQLLLSKFYQVRKNMHLGYGICRSEEGGQSHKKKPFYVLAQDSCKFGKLEL